MQTCFLGRPLSPVWVHLGHVLQLNLVFQEVILEDFLPQNTADFLLQTLFECGMLQLGPSHLAVFP